MKTHHFSLFVAVLLISTSAFAQSAAQKSFEQLKGLAGSWEGTLDGQTMHVSLRVTSKGNALMHEMRGEGPDDPITVFHLDGDRLLLTHYCTAGNQPRMQATASPDRKTLAFDFVDATNLAAHANHMQRLVIRVLSRDHHVEEWTFLENGKETTDRLDVHRLKS